ncbi:MAG: DNA/RNA helicase domain-containing protein [Olegusella sp.]|nr:DNA/RNA helicase domain-containing protein [Olegusella sp.]
MSERSYCVLSGGDFQSPNFVDTAIGRLSSAQVADFTVEERQMRAWEEELRLLRPIALAHHDCTVALEYMIPRMARRVDAVLLIGRHVILLEFKVGERHYAEADIEQVLDYAFDIRNFHSESHGRTLFPVLVSTETKDGDSALEPAADGIYKVQLSNAARLGETVDRILSIPIGDERLDHRSWLNALYQPTPTIIEAAQALYQSHEVEDISRSEAGSTNIARTTECVDRIASYSKEHGRKSICFITGVPGAGKTLVGLNIASKRRGKEGVSLDEVAVFLSGNGPLISVLQESLIEDQIRRNEEACAACGRTGSAACHGCPHKRTKSEIRAEVASFVQGVHLFREELFETDEPPAEHIAVFDEAQRAWSEDQLSKKMRTRWRNRRDVHKSEPRCLIEYMDRNRDWATMVCLVGGGQEIHDGEAGIGEWFAALHDYFPRWDIYASHAIEGENYLGAVRLSDIAPDLRFVDDLHLSVDMRSFRNKNVAAFAEAVVENRPAEARRLYGLIAEDYPIYVTRDLERAKAWVREVTKRPSDRYGVIADSFGGRIRADGISVPTLDFDAVTWFLRGKDNIVSAQSDTRKQTVDSLVTPL